MSDTVERPWGQFDFLAKGDGYQIKRIIVTPGARLSLQFHNRRAEHWIVVSGTARVTLSGETKMLKVNDSFFVPIGAVHCLENPGQIPLEIIEVQVGAYLGEDDIVRLDDLYGRADNIA